jgi:hypothetical protein
MQCVYKGRIKFKEIADLRCPKHENAQENRRS